MEEGIVAVFDAVTQGGERVSTIRREDRER